MENSAYEIEKVGKGGWRIEDASVRAFLFAGKERALLVDTGFGADDIKSVAEEMTELPIILVNTHADGDHIGGNRYFDKAYMHPAEFAKYYENDPGAEAAALWDGDVIDLGGRSFEVVLIPGHTQGSIALLNRAERMLIAGDSVSDSPIFMFGSSRNFRAYIASMKRLEAMSGCFDAVYPSHGAFRVDPGIIGELIRGAEALENGDIRGVDPPFDVPAKLYAMGKASFLAEAK